jgi:hypothetical protein
VPGFGSGGCTGTIENDTTGVKRQKRASSRAGDKTSKQEMLLVRSLKLSKKFVAKGAEGHSSGLSISEKASSVRTSSRRPLVMKAGT